MYTGKPFPGVHHTAMVATYKKIGVHMCDSHNVVDIHRGTGCYERP